MQLFTNVVVALARTYASVESVASPLLLAVLSCADHAYAWPAPYLRRTPLSSDIARTFYNTNYVPSTTPSKLLFFSAYRPRSLFLGAAELASNEPGPASDFRDFSQKINGLIAQFVGSIQAATALEVLNVAAQGRVKKMLYCPLCSDRISSDHANGTSRYCIGRYSTCLLHTCKNSDWSRQGR